MIQLSPKNPVKIISDIIRPNGYFPGNPKLPFLVYKEAFILTNETAQDVQALLKQNNWINSWINSIYDFHHYHSNTHETLVIISGHCTVQIGGDGGKCYDIGKGDVVIFPAGVSHKNMGSSADFKCVGAYPIDVSYDMNYGKPEEHPQVDVNINKVPQPSCDPIYGKEGLLFEYWI